MTVSLIIPIYNAAPYLHRCLDSVLAQKYTDFECLLVDDGSADESLSICQSFAARDSRFRVFHKENGGEADARNYGLQQASGEYVCWLDADDELLPEYISELVVDVQSFHYPDLIIQGIQRNDSGFWQQLFPSQSDGYYQLPSQNSLFFSEVNVRDFGVSFSKIFKLRLLKEKGFCYSNRIWLAVDLDFLLRYLSECKDVAVSRKANYHYYILPGSISHKIYSYQQELSGLHQLSSSWHCLKNKIGETEDLNLQCSTCLAEYVHRVVLSLYKNNFCHSSRIAKLKSIPPEYLSLYGNYFHPTVFLRLISCLIYWGFYRLADLILLLKIK